MLNALLWPVRARRMRSFRSLGVKFRMFATRFGGWAWRGRGAGVRRDAKMSCEKWAAGNWRGLRMDVSM